MVSSSNEEIQLNILLKNHDSPLAGHPGQEKTLKIIKRDFYWAGMNQFVKDYVSSCQQCSRNKKINHKKFGLLKPLQIPSGSCSSLSINFITQFPFSNNFDLILVVVDIISKIWTDREGRSDSRTLSLDALWLASKNIKTTGTTKKLSERWLRPFEVIKKIGSHAYHLKLPQQWKSVYPVFHVSLLEPVKQSSIPNSHQLPPPPVLVEEQEEWELAQVLDSKHRRGKLWYLLEWKGFSEYPERTTWEPASKFTSSPDLVKDFYLLDPDKPGPNTSRV
ncbi:hypothetical protein O181_024528 [Austropuccinia psidii MF-1]|uniref:Chromo domain-containing protein n=1 Tax=Austropuccinia psidii MF-1 TaxID=1389203 RepID=A0A9Q3CKZ0_9BASI|nr:hypothetical protein [Austropuccinia psidii MF-1]